ncbi:hypothetical protein [Rhodococcus triatomae]
MLTDERRRELSQRIRWFVAATISYNAIESVIAISEGARVSRGDRSEGRSERVEGRYVLSCPRHEIECCSRARPRLLR